MDGQEERRTNTDPREQSYSAKEKEHKYYTSSGGDETEPAMIKRPPRNSAWGFRRTWLLLILLVILILVGASGIMKMFTITESRTFTVQQTPHIKLSNHIGDVKISTGNTNTIQFKATKRYIDLFQTINTTYKQNGDTIEIQVNENEFLFAKGSPADIEMVLPASAQVEVVTKSGNLEMTGLNGQIDLQTGTGSIKLDTITLTSPSRILTDNGNIALDNVNGQIIAETKSGTMRVENAKLSNNSLLHTNGGNVEMKEIALSGNITVSSNTGSIAFQGMLQPGGNYTFKTEHGRIDFALPGNGSYHFHTSAPGENIKNEFKSNIVGDGPQATVQASTKTGLITIKKV